MLMWKPFGVTDVVVFDTAAPATLAVSVIDDVGEPGVDEELFVVIESDTMESEKDVSELDVLIVEIEVNLGVLVAGRSGVGGGMEFVPKGLGFDVCVAMGLPVPEIPLLWEVNGGLEVADTMVAIELLVKESGSCVAVGCGSKMLVKILRMVLNKPDSSRDLSSSCVVNDGAEFKVII